MKPKIILARLRYSPEFNLCDCLIKTKRIFRYRPGYVAVRLWPTHLYLQLDWGGDFEFLKKFVEWEITQKLSSNPDWLAKSLSEYRIVKGSKEWHLLNDFDTVRDILSRGKPDTFLKEA